MPVKLSTCAVLILLCSTIFLSQTPPAHSAIAIQKLRQIARSDVSEAEWRPGTNQFALAFDGRYDQCEIEIIDGLTGKTIRTLTTDAKPPPHRDLPHTLAWSKDGRWLARGYESGVISVWDLTATSDTPSITLTHTGNGRGGYVDWNYDGTRLLSIWGVDYKEKLYIWDVAQKIITFELAQNSPEGSSQRWALWNPKTDWIARWAVFAGTELFKPDYTTYGGYDPSIAYDFLDRGITDFSAWSPSGTYLAYVVKTNSGSIIGLWNIRTGKLSENFEDELVGRISSPLVWHPSGRYLFAKEPTKSLLYVWNTSTGKLETTLTENIYRMSWSSDGKYFVSWLDDGVAVWQFADSPSS